MKAFALHDLFELLDIFILERLDNETYEPVGSVPDWFEHLFPGAAEPNKPFAPGKWSPFLDNYLFDANEFWEKNKKGRSFSGPWIETDTGGQEFILEASAICLENTKVLTIEHPMVAYKEQQKLLQAGRDSLLNNERLEEEVRKRTLQIRNREEEVALRLLSAAEFRDDETGAHIRRIGFYSVVLAEKLGWAPGEIDNIRIASTMHDIGKIGIPDSVLLKPGKLSDDEFEIMKQHPIIGGKMLADSNARMIHMAYEIALCHHEKWNGSGYPKGLAGTKIPLSARIVAIADVYDALVHKRVYKPAIAEIAALNIMKESRGQHFDPGLFDLFLDSLDEFREIALYDGSEPFPVSSDNS